MQKQFNKRPIKQSTINKPPKQNWKEFTVIMTHYRNTVWHRCPVPTSPTQGRLRPERREDLSARWVDRQMKIKRNREEQWGMYSRNMLTLAGVLWPIYCTWKGWQDSRGETFIWDKRLREKTLFIAAVQWQGVDRPRDWRVSSLLHHVRSLIWTTELHRCSQHRISDPHY